MRANSRSLSHLPVRRSLASILSRLALTATLLGGVLYAGVRRTDASACRHGHAL